MEHESTLPIDTPISHYRIVRVIGRGGFGITYEAWDGSLNRRVAIKEYFPHGHAVRGADARTVSIVDSDAAIFARGLERFLDEARTLAQFHDPRIVRVHGFIEAFNTAYMIMDFESGPSLREVVLAKGSLSPVKARAVLIELLHGLRVIHDQHYLHRDIKPANIIARSNGEIVLLDFGSARIAQAQTDQNYTVVVTPGYAPIEQYDANGPQGPATDLYALGACIIFCLTGQSPPDGFKRAVTIQQNLADPLQAILAAIVTRTPSAQPLCDVVQWLMQDQVANRPEHAQVVLEMLSDATAPAVTRAVASLPLSSIRSIPATSVEPLRAFLESVIGSEATPLLFAAIRKARNAQEVVDHVVSKIPDGAVKERAGSGLRQLLSDAAIGKAVSAPRAPAAPPSDETSKQIIAAELAKYIGPIAAMLVNKGSVTHKTHGEFLAALEAEISDEDDRNAFRKAMARLPNPRATSSER
jgi:serine/threonine protein kinase